MHIPEHRQHLPNCERQQIDDELPLLVRHDWDLPLVEGLHLGLHVEGVPAEVAVPLPRDPDPLPQAVLVHVLDGARAEAGGDQGHALFAAAVANLADGMLIHDEISLSSTECQPKDIQLVTEILLLTMVNTLSI